MVQQGLFLGVFEGQGLGRGAALEVGVGKSEQLILHLIDAGPLLRILRCIIARAQPGTYKCA